MRILRVTICIMLVVGVLAMSFSVFAVDNVDVTATPYPGTEDNPLMQNNLDDIAFIIWQLLESWGISVTYQDITSYTGEVETTIQNWIWEFLDEQPSIESVLSWTLDWWFGTDFWGHLVVNNTLLEDVEVFAEWLENKYGLTNNSTVVTNPSYSVQGVALFEPGVYYRTNSDVWVSVSAYLADNSTNTSFIGYYIWRRSDAIGENNEWNIVRLFNSGGNAIYRGTAINVNGTTHSIYNGSGYPTQGGNYYYLATSTYYNFAEESVYPVGDYYEGTFSEFQAFNNTAQIILEGDTKIVTTLILLPSDNPEYANGDGLTVIDGIPQYGEIVMPDSVSVDNLPAIITQRKIPDIGNDTENPGFSVPWQAINGLIQYVAAPAGAIMAIVYEAPVEGVIMLYALIGGIIIFGMIRVMREH